MSDKMWLGVSIHSGDREFGVPSDYALYASGCRVDESGNKFIRVKGVRWFTNLDFAKRHEEIPLFRKYSPADYPTYINYDAIEVGKTADIPCDYDGKMGVPITFMDKYNPDQFEILGMSLELAEARDEIRKWYLARPEEKQKRIGNDAFYIKKDGVLVRLYDRIVIRRKKP